VDWEGVGIGIWEEMGSPVIGDLLTNSICNAACNLRFILAIHSAMALPWTWPMVPTCREWLCSTSRTPTAAPTCGASTCPRSESARAPDPLARARSSGRATRSSPPPASTPWICRWPYRVSKPLQASYNHIILNY